MSRYTVLHPSPASKKTRPELQCGHCLVMVTHHNDESTRKLLDQGSYTSNRFNIPNCIDSEHICIESKSSKVDRKTCRTMEAEPTSMGVTVTDTDGSCGVQDRGGRAGPQHSATIPCDLHPSSIQPAINSRMYVLRVSSSMVVKGPDGAGVVVLRLRTMAIGPVFIAAA